MQISTNSYQYLNICIKYKYDIVNNNYPLSGTFSLFSVSCRSLHICILVHIQMHNVHYDRTLCICICFILYIGQIPITQMSPDLLTSPLLTDICFLKQKKQLLHINL